MTTPGISIQSVASTATWAMITGTPDANYPVTNLNDLINASNVCRVAPAAGVVAMSFNLSAAASVQFCGLVRHNMAGAQTVRLRLYSAASLGGSLLYDSTAISVWPSGGPVSGYSPTRPIVATSPVTALSGRLDFASVSGTFEMAAVELAQWLPLNVGTQFEAGFDTRAQDVPLVGGAFEASDAPLARMANGQVDLVDLTTFYPQGLDFQKMFGKGKPFVYVEDYDDNTTWARRCFLARNSDLPPFVGALYRRDKFQFRLREQIR